MNEEEWTREFQNRGALWFTDGDSSHPHVLLPSGEHSDLYFEPRNLLIDGLLLRSAARDLTDLLAKAKLSLEDVDITLGPAREPALWQDLAWHVSMLVSERAHKPCAFKAVTRKEGGNGPAFVDPVFLDNQRVLLVEDEITGSTPVLLGKVALELDGKPLLFVSALLNTMCGRSCYGVPLVALVHHERHIWKAGSCPLCAQGSIPERPEKLIPSWPEAA